MDPFSLDSPGFLNLLASQTTQPFDIESSEQTRISSQCADDPSTKERRKWSPKDDVLLISAWLNTSKDPIVGNEQKAQAFWKRIAEYYNSSPQVVGTAPREVTQCKQRWGRLNEQVCKFVGCYEAASKEQASGQNENDVMKAAHDIFYNDYKVKFTLDHAWRELRHDQKWSSMFLEKDGRKDKRKNVAEDEVSDEVSQCRPPGIKACKAAKRKKNAKEEAFGVLQNMLQMKEKINKQKLLDRLLAKKDPLSEIEVTLKEKLISEMLGICEFFLFVC